MKESTRLKRLAYTSRWESQNRPKRNAYQKLRRKTTPWVHRLTSIKTRCLNPKHPQFKNYGGRGIKCLITWEELRFLWVRDEADKMIKPTVDRIDNNGHYEVSNCRFIEHSENIKRRWRAFRNERA